MGDLRLDLFEFDLRGCDALLFVDETTGEEIASGLELRDGLFDAGSFLIHDE